MMRRNGHAYKSTLLKREVSVRKIISIHYFQYMSDFVFPGESHDFWELVCVDRGEIERWRETAGLP